MHEASNKPRDAIACTYAGALVSWFGPRGLASVVFALLARRS